MKGWVYVHTADDYKKWAAENLTVAAAAPAAEEKKAEEPKKDAAPAAPTGGKAKK
jgi:hypothetical protein